MSAYRWEKERSVWLLARSKPGSSRRRRAELLQRQAGRAARKARTGVADSARHEDITPPLFRRLLATDEGSGEKLTRLLLVPVAFGIVGLLIGPALLIAMGVYAVLWQQSPKIGRLWDWPWLLAGLAVGIGGAVIWHSSGVGPGIWFVPWPLALHVYPPVLVPTWLGFQLALGLLLTGVRIRESGWAAVKPRAGRGKSGPQKNADGSFKRIADEDVIDLVPFSGDSDGEDLESKRPEKTTAIAAPVTEVPIDQVEDEPVFDDEVFVVFEDDDASSAR